MCPRSWEAVMSTCLSTSRAHRSSIHRRAFSGQRCWYEAKTHIGDRQCQRRTAGLTKLSELARHAICMYAAIGLLPFWRFGDVQHPRREAQDKRKYTHLGDLRGAFFKDPPGVSTDPRGCHKHTMEAGSSELASSYGLWYFGHVCCTSGIISAGQ